MDFTNNRSFLLALCQLHLILSYEGRGNFTKFSDALAKSGLSGYCNDRYFSFNVMLSLSIQGIIKLIWKSDGIKWQIGSNDFYADYSDFVFGKRLINSIPKNAVIFYKSIPLAFRSSTPLSDPNSIDNISNIGCVADEVLISESYLNFSGKVIESYSFDNFQWKQYDEVPARNSIIRIRENYIGTQYFVYLDCINKFFRVTEHDWVYVIGAYMCNTDFRRIINYEDKSISVPASFRLPQYLSSYLFENSETLSLDFQNRYNNINELVVENLFSYLMPGATNE